ncbi:30S ribosomal protein S8 [Candidatus Micrarchaeota archaeon CG_4_10_14_0_2_um_filter_60_11]|nr:MAG: 30S ribosomal protein S8 [Candidatus Micrarchaeota archaeon CG1_02_60_51]PIN96506.1 MAG: 30S ribosomal protein S8 [Candidatus Micrarchaeota archaeon CG10_big_fil_rev_8_21_14_0_10_60_32]PIO01878.1 MAG: 30S ribosomal protein S8 [Candidatus Micrarchaeota archaeon CG09_land_8_20_14_0_10_60_16]PIY91557.1 MAG: 30S ribosomal protein S8 [Candidatus Micrarchaeota archaeon CG_4_10_14_0_8_um_filter_60_7]PIZ90841.1 MAG: 30S ribosomal protein S8 [Candidatus Micrarchaeota archaeon CG_4_10_14_0_2_um_f
MDTLANVINSIKVAETKGNPQVKVKPASRMVREVLLLLQRKGYVGEFEVIDDGKSGEISLQLLGKIGGCGVIKPRYPVKKGDWEKFEERFLPAKGVGLLIATTPHGIMSQEEAKEKATGGRLLCYVY